MRARLCPAISHKTPRRHGSKSSLCYVAAESLGRCRTARLCCCSRAINPPKQLLYIGNYIPKRTTSIMTRHARGRREALDAAVAAAMGPYASHGNPQQPMVRPPGRHAIRLFTDAGKANPASTIVFGQRAPAPPDKSFEPNHMSFYHRAQNTDHAPRWEHGRIEEPGWQNGALHEAGAQLLRS